jgi:hypothetical protein
VRTPQTVENRPGLPQIPYRTGRHADFLQSMIAQLTDAGRPALAKLTTRDDDDFTIALLDGWAVVADVLTFYNERLANESFLRTALDRTSLQELGRLIGYQLDPGAAAQTHLAFSIEHPPTAPAAQSKDPGSSPPVTPAEVTIDTGTRVQSIPGPGEKPQTFETVESVVARPEWNSIPPSTTIPWVAGLDVKEAWLEGVGLNLKPGDVLLLAGAAITDERWDVRILDAVTPDAESGRTKIHWVPGLGSQDPWKLPASAPSAFVLRKRLNVFGYNAPMWAAMTTEFQNKYPGKTSSTTDWPNCTISDVSGEYVDIDGSHPDIVAGSWVILTKPTYRELWRVKDVTELSRAEFAVSGKVTRVALEDGENYSLFAGDVRGTSVLAVSEPLTLTEQPDPSPVTEDTVTVETDVSAMAPGRTVIVAGTTSAGEQAAEPAIVKSVVASGKRWTIEFEDNLANSYLRTSVTIHGNVALATHGETVSEILGSGSASQGFQKFALARSPLTFVRSTDPSGTRSTLRVRVNGVAWDEEATLFAAGPTDRKYSVRLDEQGRRTVRFGEGVKGSRLPTGTQNVVAEYRHGLGLAGNVAAQSLAQLLDRPLGAKGVSNPSPADGGVDPEDEDAARTTMPLSVKTLGRAVSLLDYSDFARAFTGVSKAHAAVLPLNGIRTIVVTVSFTPGTTTTLAARASDLEKTLKSFGDPQVAVMVLPHHQTTFRLALRIGVDEAYDEDIVIDSVEEAILDAFAFDRRALLQPVYRSEVVAIAHRVPGVIAVDVDSLYTGGVSALADRILPQQPTVTAGGAALPAGLLLIDSEPFDLLEAMP